MNDPTYLNTSSPLFYQVVGRDYATQNCIQADIIGASYCKIGYCLLEGACILLSEKYSGKEKATDRCIPVNEISDNGIE